MSGHAAALARRGFVRATCSGADVPPRPIREQSEASGRRTPMTEQPDPQPQSGEDADGSHASVGKDAAQPGGGRTEAETAVDDALGQGPPPGD